MTTVPDVVLDSNVVISGFLFGGPQGRILGYLVDGSIRCSISPSILDEIRDVLRRPKFGLSAAQALALVGDLADLCRIVTPAERLRVIKSDPADNAVLECALEAGAGLIVSGDGHLLKLGRWRGLEIIPPGEFVRRMEK